MSNDAINPRISDLERFKRAIERFDAANSNDPNKEIVGGALLPRELVYARRLTDWVMKLAPQASEELLLAARCQHICRWKIPRDSFEMTRVGYHRWRNELKAFHARTAGGILQETGYPASMIARVQDLNLKKDFPRDPDCQLLEDALCLLFLQFQLPELASRTTEEKMINALTKSWNKMSPRAREEALKLPFSSRERELLTAAGCIPPDAPAPPTSGRQPACDPGEERSS
jgi:hypothetical protein